MKKLAFTCICLCFFIHNLPGQNTGDLQLPFPQSDYVQILGMSGNDLRNLSNNKIPDKVDGSPYLYESWSNSAKVFYMDKEYSLKSFNYNIYSDRFEAKLSTDSVFVINPSNVDKVLVNNRVFNHYIDPESQKIGYFEELIKFDDYKILRKYAVKVKSGAINPLTNEKLANDELIRFETYYLANLANSTINKIKLKKSDVTPLFKNEKLNDVNKFVKVNSLKYSDINDVVKIIQYYNTL